MFFVLIFVSVFIFTNGYPKPYPDKCVYEAFPFVSRSDWGANRPTSVTKLRLPVPFVVIHHSFTPGACHSLEQCSQAMRGMQMYHQSTHGWVDIGYNFAVGGDGAAYEGRGWSNVGAHATVYNSISIGIVVIGDWVSAVPPDRQLETVKKLIDAGVKLGYISEEYQLIGHRQVKSTECPGEALYQVISTWDRFQANIKPIV